MTKPTYPTRKEAKAAGWFSRRHRTPDANTAAREAYHATRGRAARRERAAERNA